MRRSALAFVTLTLAGSAALAACSKDDDLVAIPSGDGGGGSTRLEQATGVTWVIEQDPASGTARLAFPKDATARVLAAGDEPFATAAAFLVKYPEVFGVRSTTDLENLETSTDASGVTHVRFQQKVQGAPADFAVLDVHFADDGGISHVTGPFYPTLAQVSAQTPALDAAGATQSALGGAAAYGVPGPAATGAASTYVGLDASGAPVLLYRVPLRASDGVHLEAQVDAMTGKLLKVLVTDHSLNASGEGMSGARESFEIDAPAAGQPYAMFRSKAGNKPQVQVLASDASGSTLSGITSTDENTWEQGVDPNGKGSAVDAIAKLEKAESWYRSTFGWVSLDNRGADIEVHVYVPTDRNPNAYYAGGRGAGTDRTFSVLLSPRGIAPTEMDTMAHEFTHAVTAHTSNLEYGGQSGALNESMSDIFGQLAEMDLRPSGDPSLVSEEFGNTARSMKDPLAFPPSADHLDEEGSVLADSVRYEGGDNGGVHILSGIPNLAWYLMTYGGAHPRRGTKIPGSLGVQASRAVYWDLERYELKRYSTFKDAAKSTLLVARYKRLARESIGCAWNAVGVLSASELQTNYGITCEGGDAGVSVCQGKADGAYCHPTLPKLAVLCRGGVLLGEDPCVDPEDGGGAGLTCQSAIYTPADADSGAGPRVQAVCSEGPLDSCTGKADGSYCSQIPGFEYASYQCAGGTHTTGEFCPTAQRCTGFSSDDAGASTIQCASADAGP